MSTINRLIGLVGLAGLVGSIGLVEADVEPWEASEVLAPSALAETIAKGARPTIAYVGPRTLFRAGRIPGATFRGPTSEAEGLDALKEWARTLPRSEAPVIYCGCCPIDKCPNIRPAYRALHAMGFTTVRVLVLSTSFEHDWVKKGFQVEHVDQEESDQIGPP